MQQDAVTIKPRAHPGQNLQNEFEQGGLGANGAAKYMIFMASGGTKVKTLVSAN